MFIQRFTKPLFSLMMMEPGAANFNRNLTKTVKMTEANINELRAIVKNFRVTELQTLLLYARRSKFGRKTELLERALSLIDHGCPTSIVIKIHELNRRRKPATATLPEPPKVQASSSKPSSDPFSDDRREDSSAAKKEPSYMQFGAGASGYAPSSMGSASRVPVHPDVRLITLPFYDLITELIKPSSLSPRPSSRFQENVYTFHLTPQQATDIASSRELTDDCIVEYGIQILLRFCLMETTSEQEDRFPSSISVRVNSNTAVLPNPIPTHKPGVEPKRPGRPLDITHICKLSPISPNVITVTWATDHIQNFCLAVSLARHLNSNILLQRLKQNGLRHPDHTRALIKEKLASNSDTEIATTSLRISLTCPLGKTRLTIPSRSINCSHLQCFDAPTFIQMNEKKPSWICPICDRPATFKSLIIDGLFTEILSKVRDTNDIQFLADGSWSPLKAKEDECKIVDDSILIQTIPDSPDESSNPGECSNRGNSNYGNSNNKKVDLIDLTETDDEDTESLSSFAGSVTSITSNPYKSRYGNFTDLDLYVNTFGEGCSSSFPLNNERHRLAYDDLAPRLECPTPPRPTDHNTPPPLLPYNDMWDDLDKQFDAIASRCTSAPANFNDDPPCDVMDFSIDKETRDDSNRDDSNRGGDSNHGDSIRSVPNREDSNLNCLSNMEAETAVDASSDSNSGASSTSSRSSHSESHPNESVYFMPTTP